MKNIVIITVDKNVLLDDHPATVSNRLARAVYRELENNSSAEIKLSVSREWFSWLAENWPSQYLGTQTAFIDTPMSRFWKAIGAKKVARKYQKEITIKPPLDKIQEVKNEIETNHRLPMMGRYFELQIINADN